jgi:hypothetical protein
MAKNFYTIKRGRETGIFEGKWKDIEVKYIKGFSNPQFKGFNSREAAEKYLGVSAKAASKKERKARIRKEQLENEAFNKKRAEENERIRFDEENQLHQELRTVLLVINGHQKSFELDKPGYYRYILLDEKTDKYAKVKASPYKPGLTATRAMVEGIIDAVNKLKHPCHIKLYAKTPFGYKIMLKGKRSPNSDVLNQLRTLLLENNHVFEEFIETDSAIEAYFIKYN